MLSALLMSGCQKERQSLAEGNAVYYWRTDLRLDSTERAFLKLYNINKVYCRYFDVVMSEGEPKPNATITFSDSLPEGVEIIPTVYITEDCMHERHEGLAEKTDHLSGASKAKFAETLQRVINEGSSGMICILL